MHKINSDKAHMVTHAVQSYGAWCWDAECSSWGGAWRPLLLLLVCCFCNGSIQNKHRMLVSLFVFFRRSENPLRISFWLEIEKWGILVYHVLFVYAWVDGHLDSFSFLAILNNVALKICVQNLFVCRHNAFKYLVYIPKSGISGLLGNSVFNCLWWLALIDFFWKEAFAFSTESHERKVGKQT